MEGLGGGLEAQPVAAGAQLGAERVAAEVEEPVEPVVQREQRVALEGGVVGGSQLVTRGSPPTQVP